MAKKVTRVRITQETITEYKRLKDEGKSYKQIARHLGRTVLAVRQLQVVINSGKAIDYPQGADPILEARRHTEAMKSVKPSFGTYGIELEDETPKDMVQTLQDLRSINMSTLAPHLKQKMIDAILNGRV